MTILAFDTCLQACSVAVLKPGEDECVHVTDTIGRGHAEVLLPMIQGVLEQADLTFSDIGQLAVTLGPGAFTGVRVGISTARGLCVGLDLNAIGYTSLHVMAREVLDVIGTNDQFDLVVQIISELGINIDLRALLSGTVAGVFPLAEIIRASQETPAILSVLEGQRPFQLWQQLFERRHTAFADRVDRSAIVDLGVDIRE